MADVAQPACGSSPDDAREDRVTSPLTTASTRVNSMITEYLPGPRNTINTNQQAIRMRKLLPSRPMSMAADPRLPTTGRVPNFSDTDTDTDDDDNNAAEPNNHGDGRLPLENLAKPLTDSINILGANLLAQAAGGTVVFILIVFLCAILMVVAYYTAAQDSHYPDALIINLITSFTSGALSWDQWREFHAARGGFLRRELLHLYSVSMITVISLNVCGWTLWVLGQKQHRSDYLRIAYLLFYGVHVQFIFILAGRSGVASVERMHRDLRDLIEQDPPEMNTESGPYAEFLRRVGSNV
jgi:hypothetical protein